MSQMSVLGMMDIKNVSRDVSRAMKPIGTPEEIDVG